MCGAVIIISNIRQNLAESRSHIQKEICQLALFEVFIVKQVGLGQKKSEKICATQLLFIKIQKVIMG